jgi:hypothetical protein
MTIGLPRHLTLLIGPTQLHPTFDARAAEYGLKLLSVDTTEGTDVFKSPHLNTTGQERVHVFVYGRA